MVSLLAYAARFYMSMKEPYYGLRFGRVSAWLSPGSQRQF